MKENRLDQKLVIHEKALSRVVEGEVVVLHLINNTYYGLNEVGTRLWHGLESGATAREVVNDIAKEYDAPTEQIEQDVIQVLEDLVKNKLIVSGQEDPQQTA